MKINNKSTFLPSSPSSAIMTKMMVMVVAVVVTTSNNILSVTADNEIYCGSGNCKDTIVNCPNDADCTIICSSGESSCSNSVFNCPGNDYFCFIQLSDSRIMTNSEVNGLDSSGLAISIDDGSNSFENSVLNCPANGGCYVYTEGFTEGSTVSPFDGATINGRDAYELLLEVDTGSDQSFSSSNIYCPDSSSFGNPDACEMVWDDGADSRLTLHETQIYSRNGFAGITLDCGDDPTLHGCEGFTMHCGDNNYQHDCISDAIDTASTSSTTAYEFTCLNKAEICTTWGYPSSSQINHGFFTRTDSTAYEHFDPAIASFNMDPTYASVFANMNTVNDAETASVAITSVNNGGFSAYIMEETSTDADTTHAAEDGGFIAFESEGFIFDVHGERIGEVGSKNVNQSGGRGAWHTKSHLLQSYVDPIVIMMPNTKNNVDPYHIRLRNIQSRQFQFQIEEWHYTDGVTTNVDRIVYMVVEAGEHYLPNGSLLQAFTKYPVNHVETQVTFDIPFYRSIPQGTFAVPPIILSQDQTRNGGHQVVTRNKDLTNEGFKVYVQEASGLDYVHMNEKIGIIAYGPNQSTITI